MSSNTITVTTSWTQIFSIPVSGRFSVYLDEQEGYFSKGDILFLEEGNNASGYEISISHSQGIDLITYVERRLPASFVFLNRNERVYEMRKNGSFLEIRLLTGPDTLVSFTLFSSSPDKSIIVIPRNDSSNNSSFSKLGNFELPPIKAGKVKAISYMSTGATSYDLRIFDKTNKNILVETNLTNTDSSSQEIGSFSNLSEAPAEIEILVRKNGNGGKVYLESLTINYN